MELFLVVPAGSPRPFSVSELNSLLGHTSLYLTGPHRLGSWLHSLAEKRLAPLPTPGLKNAFPQGELLGFGQKVPNCPQSSFSFGGSLTLKMTENEKGRILEIQMFGIPNSENGDFPTRTERNRPGESPFLPQHPLGPHSFRRAPQPPSLPRAPDFPSAPSDLSSQCPTK